MIVPLHDNNGEDNMKNLAMILPWQLFLYCTCKKHYNIFSRERGPTDPNSASNRHSLLLT